MNLFDYIEEFASIDENRIAIIDDRMSLSYGQLYRCLKYNQDMLAAKGYTRGEKIALKAQGQLKFVISLLCLLSFECWVIPIPAEATDAEQKKIVEFTGSRVFCKETLEYANIPIDYNKSVLLKPAADMTGIYHLTSGTTGIPKLCIRTLECLTAEGLCYKKTFSIKSDDRIFSVPPLYHSYALGAALMATMVSGGGLYILDGFVPRKILRTIEEKKITFLILVPFMARILCNTYTKQLFDLSSVRVALVGAGVVTKEIYDNFRDRYGIALLSNYGSTETGGVVSRLTPMPYTSIGKPMDGVEIKLCNDGGECVLPGEEGEIWVKCQGMLKGYWGESDLSLDGQGFFPMGDIAVEDEDNYLFIKGRKKLLISVGGKKVNPYEVEEVILSFPGVKDCAVAGISRPNGEQGVKAFVVGGRVIESDLRKFCVARLSSHKTPLVIEFTDSIPRNELGKIKREELI